MTVVYYHQPLNDSKLEALRTFTRAGLEAHGWIDRQTLQSFYQADYNPKKISCSRFLAQALDSTARPKNTHLTSG